MTFDVPLLLTTDVTLLLIEKLGRFAYRRANWRAQLEQIRALPETER